MEQSGSKYQFQRCKPHRRIPPRVRFPPILSGHQHESTLTPSISDDHFCPRRHDCLAGASVEGSECQRRNQYRVCQLRRPRGTVDESIHWRYGAFLLENITGDGRYRGDVDEGGLYGRVSGSPWYDEVSGGRGYFHWAISGAVTTLDGDGDVDLDDNANEGRFRTISGGRRFHNAAWRCDLSPCQMRNR